MPNYLFDNQNTSESAFISLPARDDAPADAVPNKLGIKSKADEPIDDEYFLYKGVSLIDAINEAQSDLIVGLVRAIDNGHHEFVSATLKCLIDDYDLKYCEDNYEAIVGSFR